MAQEQYPEGVTGTDDLAEQVVAVGKTLYRTGDKTTASAELLAIAARAQAAGKPVAAAQMRAAARVPGPPNQMRKAIGATVAAMRAAP